MSPSPWAMMSSARMPNADPTPRDTPICLLAGLILAAGESRRFGPQPKLLAKLEGRPLLEHAIRAQCATPQLARVVVVLGAHAAEISAAIDFERAEPVIFEQWRQGQAGSLRCGLAQLPHATKVIVTLGDQPLMTPRILARFVDAPPGARAVYHGRPGHPVVLGPEQMRAIEQLTGDSGARQLVANGLTIECADLSSGRDVDTREDLDAIRAEAEPGGRAALLPRSQSAHLTAARRRRRMRA
jgi:molybdenum cofactor cytidylyltransferase